MQVHHRFPDLVRKLHAVEGLQGHGGLVGPERPGQVGFDRSPFLPSLGPHLLIIHLQRLDAEDPGNFHAQSGEERLERSGKGRDGSDPLADQADRQGAPP